MKFHKDVIIDLIGYRKNGHNEVDNPDFTQPLMYKEIRSRKSIYHQYRDELLSNNDITQEEVDEMYKKLIDEYEKEEKKAFDNKVLYKKDNE